MWKVVGGELSLKISAPYFWQFGSECVLAFEDVFIKDHRMTDWLPDFIMKVFIEEARLHQVC